MQISETKQLTSGTATPIFETDEGKTFLRCTACKQDVLPEHMELAREAARIAYETKTEPDLKDAIALLEYHADGECLRLDVLQKATAPRKPTAIIIPREHQSAPKEHWAAKEIREAAREIVEGQFIVKDDPEEFWNYGETMTVAQHPRVKEALKKLELEMSEPSNSQEGLEKAQMYHELNEMSQQKDQWDGQGRWIGKHNEEMRRGQILSPFQFMQKLTAVIGERRVEMNYFGVRGRVALLAPDPNYKASLIHTLTDNPRQLEFLKGKCQVGTLQYPLGTEWMIMRFSEYGVPTTPKFLGWRTALLSLVKLNIITEKEAHKAFPLSSGPAADWYKAQLYMLRNGTRVDA
jgi:hypothetical protein